VAHCDNCGVLIVQDTGGEWVHEVSPPGFDPANCVIGVSDGVPDGVPDGPPWWSVYVKE
jgi:hypothetical protein